MKDLFINSFNYMIYSGDATAMLIAAVNKGDKSISSASFAVNRGADVNAKDASGNPLLYTVIKLHAAQTAELLLSQEGIDINATSVKDGSTVAHCIAKYADLARIKVIEQILSKEGLNINARDVNGNTPLHFAFMNNGNFDIAKLFLAKEVIDPNVKNNSGNTPLHEVVSTIDNTTMPLSKAGLDISATNIALLLSKEGVDSSATNNEGQTALHLAALRGNIEAVKSLISHGINTEAKDLGGLTALDYAMAANQLVVAKTLVDARVDINPSQLVELEKLGVISSPEEVTPETPSHYYGDIDQAKLKVLDDLAVLKVDAIAEAAKTSVDTQLEEISALEAMAEYGDGEAINEYDLLMKTQVEAISSPLSVLEEATPQTSVNDDVYGDQAALDEYDLSVLKSNTPQHHDHGDS